MNNDAYTLPIHEIFSTWQGEGVHMGRAAFFIRTYGCPLHCPWCDSAGTWHKDYRPSYVKRMGALELADEAGKTHASFAVITGGEPTVHNLHPLTQALRLREIKVHLETSGAFPIAREDFDWITVSPKKAKLPLLETLGMADELKLIIENETDLYYWRDYLEGVAHPFNVPIWLHVEWSQRNNNIVLNDMTTWVKLKGDPYRIGFQLHKLFRADLMDNRSAQAVPLGGNLQLGY